MLTKMKKKFIKIKNRLSFRNENKILRYGG